MVYLGNFEFDEEDTRGLKKRHGWFMMAVDADNQNAAVSKFKTQILNLKKSAETFDQITLIFLKEIIEIKKAPKQACLISYVSHAGEFKSSVSLESGYDSSGINRYEWVKGEKETVDERPGIKNITPFLSLDSTE